MTSLTFVERTFDWGGGNGLGWRRCGVWGTIVS